MKNRKWFGMLLSVLLVVSLLAGCSGGNGTAGEGTGTESSDTTANEETSGEEQAVEEEVKETPNWQTEKFTLTYASWGDTELEKKMFEAFMEKYPNITVVKDESINWPWSDALAAAASAGKLPDVFWMDNVPTAVENDWAADLTFYWDNDPEAAKVYPNIAEQAVFGGKRYASATFQFPLGIHINKTLFEKNNIALPAYDWTIDEMLDLAVKLSNPAEHIYGIGGPWGDTSFNDHWPFQNNQNMGYSTWDGEKFHFTHPDWIEGYNKKMELRKLKVDNYVMTPEEKEQAFGNKDAWPFMEGAVAMEMDGSWNRGWMPVDMQKKGYETEFYPFPGGKAGQRNPVILDFIGISTATKYPEAAYELMKFMSWGEEGWLKRYDLTMEKDGMITQLPIADQPAVWAKIEEGEKEPGFKHLMSIMPQSVPNFDKMLPGWNEFWKWASEEQKIFEKIDKGELAPADVAKQLEDKANEFYQAGLEKMLK